MKILVSSTYKIQWKLCKALYMSLTYEINITGLNMEPRVTLETMLFKRMNLLKMSMLHSIC